IPVIECANSEKSFYQPLETQEENAFFENREENTADLTLSDPGPVAVDALFEEVDPDDASAEEARVIEEQMWRDLEAERKRGDEENRLAEQRRREKAEEHRLEMERVREKQRQAEVEAEAALLAEIKDRARNSEKDRIIEDQQTVENRKTALLRNLE